MKIIALPAALAPLMMFAVQAAAAESASWSGYYVGIHGGYDWLDTDIGNYQFYDQDYEGFSGGIQAGVDHHLPNNFVVGLSVDFGLSDTTGRRTLVSDIGGLLFVTDARVERDAYGALRGRLGYALGDFLPYATVGIAWARHKVSYTQTFMGTTVTNLQQKQDHRGWLAGGCGRRVCRSELSVVEGRISLHRLRFGGLPRVLARFSGRRHRRSHKPQHPPRP